jgi:putative transposase
VKRHILTDGRGIPISATTTAANVHDMRMAGAALDAVVVRSSRGPRRPRHLCLDKGYDFESTELEVRSRGITPHIRRRGEPALLGIFQGKARRWVVERTQSWINRFRSLLIRWERSGTRYDALLHLGCALVTFRCLSRA